MRLHHMWQGTDVGYTHTHTLLLYMRLHHMWQGADVGSQYGAAVFCHSRAQQDTALESRERLQAGLSQPVVTAVRGAVSFWPAGPEHQK